MLRVYKQTYTVMVNENPTHLEDVLMISMDIFLFLDIHLGKLLREIRLGHYCYCEDVMHIQWMSIRVHGSSRLGELRTGNCVYGVTKPISALQPKLGNKSVTIG